MRGYRWQHLSNGRGLSVSGAPWLPGLVLVVSYSRRFTDHATPHHTTPHQTTNAATPAQYPPAHAYRVPLKQVAKELSDVVKEKVKDLGYDRYKLIVQVTVGQKVGQAMRIASRCLWVRCRMPRRRHSRCVAWTC